MRTQLKINKWLLLLLVTLVLSAALGCRISRDRDPVPTVVVGREGSVSLTLENESNRMVCYVQIAPTSASEWGEDWLGPTEVIDPGRNRVFNVPIGHYDVRALDCNEGALLELYNVDLSSEDRVLFVWGG